MYGCGEAALNENKECFPIQTARKLHIACGTIAGIYISQNIHIRGYIYVSTYSLARYSTEQDYTEKDLQCTYTRWHFEQHIRLLLHVNKPFTLVRVSQIFISSQKQTHTVNERTILATPWLIC